ncbi:MAG: TrmH family RNA methyltransferase [Candidatus Lokiarchaeota archaeon]|nr:TrmH family RNA methyltransferase [Candidatus Lokiarchaeota archaeon]
MPKAICLTGWKYTINVLAAMRTADGFGFDEFVIAGQNPLDEAVLRKVARRNLVDLVGGLKLSCLPDLESVLHFIDTRHYSPVLLECKQGVDVDTFSWPENPIIVVGHEVTGIPLHLFPGAPRVHVHMARVAHSLNLACAASIAMHSLHLHEQRYKEEKI